jgi:hypothetical protein
MMPYRWHWKSAALSAMVRGSLFFATNVAAGIGVAGRATLVECAFAVPLIGMLASVTQAFRDVRPSWAAVLLATTILPLIAQGAEFVVHWMAGTPQLHASTLASFALSAMSTVFNLFVMRRGVMIVGDGSRPFLDDLKRLPALLVDFVCIPFRALVS